MANKALFLFIFLAHVSEFSFGTEVNPYSLSQGYQVVSEQSCGCTFEDKNKQNIEDMANAMNKAFEVPSSICSLKPGQFDEIIKNKGQSFENSSALSSSIKTAQVLIAGEMHKGTQ